jgi:hypothetical protein
MNGIQKEIEGEGRCSGSSSLMRINVVEAVL